MSPYWKYRKFIQYQEYFINKFKRNAYKRFRKFDFIWSSAIFCVIISMFIQIMNFRISWFLGFNILTIMGIAYGIRKHLQIQKQTQFYIRDFEETLSELKEMPNKNTSFDDVINNYTDQLRDIYKKHFHT